ncbi:helix-turn-helix transcriptional regulator [Cloacibacillus sp. An23]|uniref:helix-turn-helix domain-containing protein n=1 Tax=Cloacibacillus sp. An23 TaxID=1965591 RepID=UPI0019519E0C|nr:helix-turn-helix transcriptional regulator [Cloacibacillus sp. An23]
MIGANLKAARENMGLSQTQLGEILGTTQNTVWRWENDRITPDDDTKLKLAQILNVSVAYLMGENDSLTPKGENSIDKMLSELSQIDPDLVARFRSTGENWSRFSDEEKVALIDGLNFVLGRSVSSRLKLIGKDKRI